jgi:hypothetical protein
MIEKKVFYFFKVKFEKIGYPEDKSDKNEIISQVFKKKGDVMLGS